MKITRKQLKQMIREEIDQMKEADSSLEKAPIPAQVKRWMAKFVESVSEAKLNIFNMESEEETYNLNAISP